MADFINTIDELGDDVVLDSIIDRTIEEFNDDQITMLPASAFRGCSKLKSVRLPNVSGQLNCTFYDCSGLETVDLPKVTSVAYDVFAYSKIRSLCLPSLREVVYSGLRRLEQLVTVDLPACVKIDGSLAFYNCWAMKNVILRSNTMCTLGAVSALYYYVNTHNNNLRIFVPSALIEDYKAATNWSDYADQFYALEDFTTDGTKDGEFCCYTVTNTLRNVVTSNGAVMVGPRAYTATLTSATDDPISEVTITMGGVDVTAEVYNPETGEINIPAVTGHLTIGANNGSVSYEVIQGYPANPNTSSTFMETTNGATSVYFQATPGTIIHVSMTERTTNRFRIGFAKQPIANGVALYQPIAYDDTALESTFAVPEGYTYVMAYLGFTPYPNVEPGLLIEDLTAGGSNTLKIEQGSIGYGSSDGGADKSAANYIRTDFIPFDGSGDVSISVSDTTYKVTLRGYDYNKTYKAANGAWINMPGTITYGYPYLRLIIGRTDSADFDVSTLHGAVLTVDGVRYTLSV